MSRTIRTGLAAAAFITLTGPAWAGEPLFGYTYTTDLLPKGEMEYEQWATYRYKQSQGTFGFLKLRSELEYGITDNLQIAGYLNYSNLNANGNDTNGETTGIGISADHDPSKPYHKTRFDSASVELIYRVLSPYTDPIGLALYVEPTYGPRERSMEFRVIAQKNFLDDRLVLAGNVFTELEWVKSDAEFGDPTSHSQWEKLTELELDLGASYRFAPNWFAGVEYRNHNEYGGHTLSHSDQEHTAHFFGPTLHYGGKDWFATLSVLKQIHATGYNEEQKAAMDNGRLYGDEHTLYDGIRLKVGFLF